MNEDQVHWVGTNKHHLADDEQFVAAIRTVCEAGGYRFDRLISAMGPYGTWVAEIHRDGADLRVVWNGKDEQLVLQVQLPQGGWEDPVVKEVPEQTCDGFVERVGALLAAAPKSQN